MKCRLTAVDAENSFAGWMTQPRQGQHCAACKNPNSLNHATSSGRKDNQYTVDCQTICTEHCMERCIKVFRLAHIDRTLLNSRTVCEMRQLLFQEWLRLSQWFCGDSKIAFMQCGNVIDYNQSECRRGHSLSLHSLTDPGFMFC